MIDRSTRRLVLLPVERDQPIDRRMQAEVGPDESWELADPWGPQGAVAIAVTRRVDELVVLVQVTLVAEAPREATRCLIQQLVATLRRTDASAITSSIANQSVRSELLAVGFIPLPGDTDAVGPNAADDRLILQL